MRSIDEPTAAFPIGALQGIVKSLSDAEDAEHAEDAREAVGPTSTPAGVVSWEVDPWEHASSGVSVFFLLLSLVAGAVVAIGVVSVFAVAAFLL